MFLQYSSKRSKDTQPQGSANLLTMNEEIESSRNTEFLIDKIELKPKANWRDYGP